MSKRGKEYVVKYYAVYMYVYLYIHSLLEVLNSKF